VAKRPKVVTAAEVERLLLQAIVASVEQQYSDDARNYAEAYALLEQTYQHRMSELPEDA